MAHVPDNISEIITRVSREAGTIEEYEKLNILLRNLSRDGIEAAVSIHNLLDIFNFMVLVRRYCSLRYNCQ